MKLTLLTKIPKTSRTSLERFEELQGEITDRKNLPEGTLLTLTPRCESVYIPKGSVEPRAIRKLKVGDLVAIIRLDDYHYSIDVRAERCEALRMTTAHSEVED